jgi:hypothetical protein
MDRWLEDFKQTIDAATPRLLQLSESQSEAVLSAGGWSSTQTIGHLIDSAANNHARFVLAQLKNDLLFAGYEQDGWVRVQQYQKASWPQLVELWRAYNVHLLHVMSCTPQEKLTNRCTQHSLQTIAFETVDERKPVTLEYLMKEYVVHLKHHLSQIFGEA